MNLLNVDNRDWQINIRRKKNLQMILSNVDNRDWQINVGMRKKKLQMNLLNVGKRDCKRIKSIEKIFPIV